MSAAVKPRLVGIHEVDEKLEPTAELPAGPDWTSFVPSSSPRLSEEYFRDFLVTDEEHERCARCRPRRMVRR